MNLGIVLAESDNIGVGLAGFFVILGLIVAVVFLLRSMNRHLKKVPPEFEEPEFQEPQATENEEAAYPDRPAADREEPLL